MKFGEFCREMCFKTVVEVGVHRGANARAILKDNLLIEKLYLVDPWATYESIGQAESNDKRMVRMTTVQMDGFAMGVYEYFLLNDKVRIIRAMSRFVAPMLGADSIDCVYIDADHSYRAVIRDIGTWIGVVNSRGVIAGHDYSSGWPDVVRAIDGVFDKSVLNRLESGSWYVNKKDIDQSECLSKINDLLGAEDKKS